MTKTKTTARKTIYLAGGKGLWRDPLASRWHMHDLIDPFKDSRQGSLYQFTNDDLAHVDRADFVFAFVDYPSYTGTALEFGYAHALGKPIYYATSLPRVDSMMAAVASYVFTSLDAAVAFVEERVF